MCRSFITPHPVIRTLIPRQTVDLMVYALCAAGRVEDVAALGAAGRRRCPVTGGGLQKASSRAGPPSRSTTHIARSRWAVAFFFIFSKINTRCQIYRIYKSGIKRRTIYGRFSQTQRYMMFGRSANGREAGLRP
jgi:hypothetical protein